MKKPKKLPQQIYIYWDEESDPPFLIATETTLGIEHGTPVGVYELAATKKKKITEELV